jgi:phage baseplate assembly protein W
METSYLDHPLRLDGRGRVATTQADDHVRDMIYQVLFTNPGERVNRPDFGCGLLQLVFEPNSEALATATQFLVQGALQRWLADVIQVEQLEITGEEERLMVDVIYVRLDTGQRQRDLFVSPTGGL